MHHLCSHSRRHSFLSERFVTCQALVRFFALHRIKPHTPPLVRAPVNSFEFHSCERIPGGILNALATILHGLIRATSSIHRLRLGLLGYLIPFAPLAVVSQCQLWSSRVPSPLVFFLIYAFHRYTRNSLYLYHTQVWQFPLLFWG